MFTDKPGKNAKNGADDEMIFDAPGAEEEEAEVSDIEEGIREKLKKYKEKLKTCQKERGEYLDGWQRSKADYLNNKRRLEEERLHENERNAAHFVEKLLPLCDSFDLALANLAKENGTRNEAKNDRKSDWRNGIEQIYNQLRTVLKSYTVEVLTPLGVAFDPHFHEAVSEIPVTSAAQHHIIFDVLQNGYVIGERLVRPAKVVVGNYEMHQEEK
jgi:molecular chaperone GrpE